ncbi:hypothetical protein OE88DRAFT_249101 [Heliocybe sulcata]|uniref:Uncharacterized protein n=1 Tax=Heliocybe sulcata TaxID=5364 RepID=A0A5C3MZP4_9AGAM|nr:hypothetical protein OE88DRAFT_249101 [Heliocybe sulcata]
MSLQRKDPVEKRNNSRVLWTLIILFILSTVSLVLGYAYAMLGPGYFALYDDPELKSGAYNKKDLRHYNDAFALQSLMHFIYTTKQIFADGLLAYRCYVVWSSNLQVVAIPCLLIAAGAVFGYMEAITELRQLILYWGISVSNAHPIFVQGDKFLKIEDVYAIIAISVSLVGNIVITGLTASRIYMLSREFRATLGREVDARYSTVVNMVIESGAVFSLSLLVWLTVNVVGYKEVATFTVFPCVNQIAGIAPTAIAVRIALHKSSEHAYSLPTIQISNAQNTHAVSMMATPIEMANEASFRSD